MAKDGSEKPRGIRLVIHLVRETVRQWQEDRAPRLAAALAYYTIFSIAPLLVVVISFIGLFTDGEEAARSLVLGEVGRIIGFRISTFLADMITAASSGATGPLAAVLGTVTLLWASVNIFNELHNALNTIWNVKAKPPESFLIGVRTLVLNRLLAFGVLLGFGALIWVSVLFSTLVARLSDTLGETFPGRFLVLQLINIVVALLVNAGMFAAIFKVLPDIQIRWRDAFVGGMATSVLFNVGRILIGLYLANSQPLSGFGTAGSLVVLLVWIYYSAQILFFGAEFTQVYTKTIGDGARVTEAAEQLPLEDRLKQGMEPKTQPRQSAEQPAVVLGSAKLKPKKE